MSSFEVMSGPGWLVKFWTRGVQVEEEARKQLMRLARMPFVEKWVAVMPDVHAGIGSTIGSVIATRGAVIPAAVGVDIGCGMVACCIDRHREHLAPAVELRAVIESAVPHGRTDNGGANDVGSWIDGPPKEVVRAWLSICNEFDKISLSHPEIAKSNNLSHLGTLGTGNHFIELSEDEHGRVWIVIHSGSRGVGGKIGAYFAALAKRECAKWFVPLEEPNLAYLVDGTKEFDDYLRAVKWAQRYAKENRRLMLAAVLSAIGATPGETIDCHHNFVDREHHYGQNYLITRKGAVRARSTDFGIIPGSMGAKSFIVRGKGNQESFCSCSHGAGRAMSRTEAKKRFTPAEHELATTGIECRKDLSVIDETPGAYKDIEVVMAAQSDLVEVVHTLKQFVCVKG